jgi:hypothetical protein
MLSLLLDENISDKVADQIAEKQPQMSVVALCRWEEGRYLSRDDGTILRAAAGAGLTLVTYDQRTIPPLLGRLAEDGTEHAGIIFVDDHTIPARDLGGLIRALIRFWEQACEWDWTNRVSYLRAYSSR